MTLIYSMAHNLHSTLCRNFVGIVILYFHSRKSLYFLCLVTHICMFLYKSLNRWVTSSGRKWFIQCFIIRSIIINNNWSIVRRRSSALAHCFWTCPDRDRGCLHDWADHQLKTTAWQLNPYSAGKWLRYSEWKSDHSMKHTWHDLHYLGAISVRHKMFDVAQHLCHNEEKKS